MPISTAPSLATRLLNAVNQAVIATDLDGIIVYWNRFAEQLYAWPPFEVLGRQVLEVMPGDGARGQAAAVFEPFRRLEGAQHFEGTGIGLATVQRIVERHGGRVRAEGAAGEGAAFYVWLPAERRRSGR